MPDITIADTGSGVVNVIYDTPVVKVLGTRLYIEVAVTSSTEVTVTGTRLFLRLRLEWNGGSAMPTILSALPYQEGWDADPNFGVEWWGNAYDEEFIIRWSHSGFVAESITVSDIEGTSFDGVLMTEFVQWTPKDYLGFVMTLGGTTVYPADGDRCTLIIPDNS